MKYVIRDSEANGQAPIGGKARTLATLRCLAGGVGDSVCSGRQECLPHVAIPAWFALTFDAFEDSLSADQRDALNAASNPSSLRDLVQHVVPSLAVQAEIKKALADLCPNGELVAVRSSAGEEDGRQHSFAGQFESYLSVPAGEVADKVADVWRSGFSERVLAYRREHGLASFPSAPAVLIQRMVRADAAGVAFGADPATGQRDVAIVCAVRGSGVNLVSGACDADTFRVDIEGQNADRAAVAITPSVSSVSHLALTADQVRAVAELAVTAGRYLGGPQDIEWACEGTQLYLLQSRPITTLEAMSGPLGVLSFWDNSNIAESYHGITTPLTFSFARRAYEEVYRQFCRILGVPLDVLARNDNTFRNMLGLIRGRVYYNMLNWYRALAMLPGFTWNRQFMEQMMGVKEPLPESIASELARAGWRTRLRDGFHLLVSAGALIASHFTLAGRKRRFLKRLDAALGASVPDLSRWSADDLAAYYRDLERRLLPHWDAPLVNDFLCMIFFGLLGKFVAKWCPDAGRNLQNDLLSGERETISAQPAAAIRAMAEMARGDPALVRALCDDSRADIFRAMDRLPPFRAQFDAYLEKFGGRCLEELKLESLTLHDDPLLLLRCVGRLAGGQESGARGQESGVRSQGEERVRQAIRFHPIRRVLFWWLLRNARARVRDRENLRFERTRMFARARQIFIELGRRFHDMGLLDDPRDVFYLEVNEVLGFAEGTATCTNLRGLAALRKAEFASYRQMDAPAGRFETRGVVYHGNVFQAQEQPAVGGEGEQRQGLACCAGIVRGKARVITDPRTAFLYPGEILVAERTDPGWIMLFPAAAGIVVERGSLLSHSAIVARELGIPAVVSVPGVMAWLKDGDLIQLDGSLGLVTRISRTPLPQGAGRLVSPLPLGEGPGVRGAEDAEHGD